MEVKEFVSLGSLNSFRIDSKARYYVELKSKSELREAQKFAKLRDLKTFILGGGSNILLPELFDGLVIHNRLKGHNILRESGDHVYIKVDAGLNWDEFVKNCLERGYYGLENLSYIPGSVGASPVQNISAYGVEVREFIETVEVFNFADRQEFFFRESECYFSYRNSIFKNNPNFFITSVIFRLLKKPKLNLTYRDIAEHVSKNKTVFTAKSLRNLVIDIRKNKLPDPEVIPNAGSFFHNPIVENSFAEKLRKEYKVPIYTADSGKIKLSAGWLIENTGLKGYREGRVGVYDKNALVLVNYGGATQKELLELAKNVKEKVYAKFKVKLDIEPIIIS